MKINPYLIFNGDCKDAFTFYAQALQGKLEVMTTFGDTPARDHTPAQFHSLIIHTRLEVGDQALMGSDTTPDRATDGFQGFSVALQVNSIAEAERVFAALAAKGTIQMPLEQTFWAVRFGMLTDHFGVSWMVNCEQEG
ncbi:VOC family protein [Pseudomonas sp. R5(2019)]|uniref:VOC family protein n=1 Tax=Pseudomonas sp. R5(2019) TaxID=2697566 RepID=UPI00141284EE|nr:VOC family protein [Pseudomonas sp. R5(2019)]NBA98598.1 VOC family protein [Pseudomonas sp. R5(2019)]